jgi:hypothetical protein
MKALEVGLLKTTQSMLQHFWSSLLDGEVLGDYNGLKVYFTAD